MSHDNGGVSMEHSNTGGNLQLAKEEVAWNLVTEFFFITLNYVLLGVTEILLHESCYKITKKVQ